MQVRPGTEADLDQISRLTGTGIETARGFLRDRSVRIGESDDRVIAVLTFQDDGTALHITRLVGKACAYEALLADPVNIARQEQRAIETIVRDSRENVQHALETVGFMAGEAGPTFEGETTTWYRFVPESV